MEITGTFTISGDKIAIPMYHKKLEMAMYNLNKNGTLACGIFLRKAMLRRVPVETGFLKDSIKMKIIKKTNEFYKLRISVNAPYALAQEFGYTHPTAIPIDYILQHMGSPGSRGNYVDRTSGWVYPTKYTPYIRPSIKALIRNIPTIYKRKWYQEVRKQGKISKTIKLL